MNCSIHPLALAALLTCAASASMAAAPSWIDWSSPSAGTLTIGSTVVGVTLTGSTPASLVNGDYYYYNASTGGTAPGGTYGGLAPSDMLQVNYGSTFTLTFSQAITNPYVALVSVGQPNLPISYTFNGAINSLSAAGNNYWGTGSGSFGGSTFTGLEYNGVLQLNGNYQSLTITTAADEYWHGFNVGTAALVTAVPEPETFALLLAGLGLVGTIARKRKHNAQV